MGDKAVRQPAAPTEAFVGLDAGPRDVRDEPALAQPGQVFGGEVRLVRAEFDGSAPPGSPAGPDGGYAADERLEGEAVVHVRAGHGGGERDALGIGQHVQLAALLQSTSPRAPSPSSTVRCSRRHRPASVHTVKRRCAVAGKVPNVGGRCRQAQPLSARTPLP
ncbi:hypothetical protein V2J94_41015 [Streptomyces sp. DSM 41524]|uniref:Uncharacterized protein n=1 Tax=Streptomyces asiaticus subsp. ignotus TaxID=3098222 RepID=A0ABU7Q9T7_9ACTN|nr:hypothetical protein [Streptomyces sp. DSM 41524]